MGETLNEKWSKEAQDTGSKRSCGCGGLVLLLRSQGHVLLFVPNDKETVLTHTFWLTTMSNSLCPSLPQFQKGREITSQKTLFTVLSTI